MSEAADQSTGDNPPGPSTPPAKPQPNDPPATIPVPEVESEDLEVGKAALETPAGLEASAQTVITSDEDPLRGNETEESLPGGEQLDREKTDAVDELHASTQEGDVALKDTNIGQAVPETIPGAIELDCADTEGTSTTHPEEQTAAGHLTGLDQGDKDKTNVEGQYDAAEEKGQSGVAAPEREMVAPNQIQEDRTENQRKAGVATQPERTQEVESKQTVTPWLLPISILVILLGTFIAWRQTETPSPPAPSVPLCDCTRNDSCTIILENGIDELRTRYPEQDETLWITLTSAAIGHASCQQLIRPITILVYHKSTEESNRLVKEIGKVYSTLLANSNRNVTIYGSDYIAQDPENVQRNISAKFEDGFKNGVKVAVVHNFDSLPTCSMLMFHNYCNNEDAPHTGVSIILTMTGSEGLDGPLRPREMETIVSGILHEKWSDCPDDMPPGKVEAVLSRVANNVVFIR